MKKVLNFLKRNIAIHMIIGAWLGVMGAVYVIYSNAEVSSGLSAGSVAISKTNMQDVPEATLQSALDYLYEKAALVGQAETCPDGLVCSNEFIYNLAVGDLIKMSPTETSIQLDGSKSGFTTTNGATSVNHSGVTYYPYDDTQHPTYLNPSELQYWRVISKNTNGTVDDVSEYISSVPVYFRGNVGYANYIGYLNELASHYENPTYTIESRYIGYDNQTEYITDTSAFNGSSTRTPWTSSTSSRTSRANEVLGAGDMGYENDYNLVKNAYINKSYGGNTYSTGIMLAYIVGTTNTSYYFIASRTYSYSSPIFSFQADGIDPGGTKLAYDLRRYNSSWSDYSLGGYLRPILTLRANVTSSGTESGTGAYVLG